MVVPDGVPAIPAMTSEAERRCYYELTKQQNQHGFVVELGTWLGAATAWIAAGVRDSGVGRKAHVYDRFVWNRNAHERKAGKALTRDMLEEFKANLGPLLEYVVPHRGEIADIKWTEGNVSLIVFDAPKRIPAISAALTIFADHVYSGTILAWQDFTHSSSYDIPATINRLGDKLEFMGVVPGSTGVFRVREVWTKDEVTPQALAPERWRPDEIQEAWEKWVPMLPRDMAAHFLAGEAMFLCERGAVDEAQETLRYVLDTYGNTIIPKWRDMREHRARIFLQRFQPLFDVMRGRI